ncbi:adenylate kinase family enzyme [Anaerosolibacter carboniphilus]|uniref:Adenylate kinase family enzyme n=1 Tax=Anaerosolibacter carboniphilus TaxID=1417629 RepID=A0A841L4Q2_9FIRM|nr:adenylate kinase family enzyme [Anaerosolibacter carboniphilus]
MDYARSLEDIKKLLKENSDQKTGDLLNELTGIFLTAGTLISIIRDPGNATQCLATAASISAIKPSALLDYFKEKFNYHNRGSALSVKERYERLSYINLMLIHIAAKEAFKELVLPPVQEYLIKGLLDRSLDEKLNDYAEEVDGELLQLGLDLPSLKDKDTIIQYLNKIFFPIENILSEYLSKCDKRFDLNKIMSHSMDRTLIIYNAFIIGFSKEFPEFYNWVDINSKDSIIDYCKILIDKSDEQKELFNTFIQNFDQIIDFHNNRYREEFSFSIYEEFIRRHGEAIPCLYEDHALNQVMEHHNVLKGYLNKTVSSDDSIELIKYPKNEEIFIPQSFKVLKYKKTKHFKKILSPSYWDKSPEVEFGEDITQTLMAALLEPSNSFRPIVILGNPGAGKSMFSNIFAARLCDSTEYVPFLIKLRDIQSSNMDVSDHIKQGLEKTIPGSCNIQWISWVKKFSNRTPIFILDGFDELIQTSQSELNGYLLQIQKLQQEVYDAYNIVIKVIITSRLTIMQEVRIPDDTTIIKLDSFDNKRRQRWIKKWNSIQVKSGFRAFDIPSNPHIQELAKEPLLLFMLAVYDFEGEDLKTAANSTTFNQSQLYDNLFIRFAERQLNKNNRFKDFAEGKQRKEAEVFRLRLGLIALMMFLNDSTSHNCSSLKTELLQFALADDNIRPEEIFTGFFFIHENNSNNEQNERLTNFEFLHKTFGEFLAADFLIRVLNYHINDSGGKLSDLDTVRYVYGYNWLNKHPNIINFLFEMAPKLIEPENCKAIGKLIKNEIKSVFAKGSLPFPVSSIQLTRPETQMVIDHLAMYSQNLIIMWNVICRNKDQLEFVISAPEQIYMGCEVAATQEINEKKIDFEVSQDSDEIDINRSTWKKLSILWSLTGNKAACARLGQWFTITDDSEITMRLQKKEIKHYFLEAARIACNDYELLLAFNNADFTVTDIKAIVDNRPMLLKIVLDLLFNRFEYLLEGERENFVDFLIYIVKDNEVFLKLTANHKIIIKILEYRLKPLITRIIDDIDIVYLINSEELTLQDKMKLFVFMGNMHYATKKMSFSMTRKTVLQFFERATLRERLDMINNIEFTRYSFGVLSEIDEYRYYFLRFISDRYNITNQSQIQEYLQMVITNFRLYDQSGEIRYLIQETIKGTNMSERLAIVECVCRYYPDREFAEEILRDTYLNYIKRNNARNSTIIQLKLLELIDAYSVDPYYISDSIIGVIENLRTREERMSIGNQIKMNKIFERLISFL